MRHNAMEVSRGPASAYLYELRYEFSPAANGSNYLPVCFTGSVSTPCETNVEWVTLAAFKYSGDQSETTSST